MLASCLCVLLISQYWSELDAVLTRRMKSNHEGIRINAFTDFLRRYHTRTMGKAHKRIRRSVYQPYGPIMCSKMCSSHMTTSTYEESTLSCTCVSDNELNSTVPTQRVEKTDVQFPISRTTSSHTLPQSCCSTTENRQNPTPTPKCANPSYLFKMEGVRCPSFVVKACKETRKIRLYKLAKRHFDVNCVVGMFLGTPVMMSASHGNIVLFNFLVDKTETKLCLINKYGNNLLQMAIMGGNKEILKTVIDRGLWDISRRSSKKSFPLETALRFGNNDAFDLLVKKGADVNLCRKKSHGNILHVATSRSSAAMVAHILDMKVPCLHIESRDGRNYTPVMIASEACHLKIVEMLMERGCDMSVMKTSFQLIYNKCNSMRAP